MFELDRYDPTLLAGPPASPAGPYQPAADIQKMSVLFWTEHCVECAAPCCYQTCDLYQARADKRCRRFTFGARKNAAFASVRGFGVEIEFKKWAKLEAYGNRAQLPLAAVRRRERLIEWAAPTANLLGRLLHKLTGKERWLSATHVALEELVRRYERGHKGQALPDALLFEVYNPGHETVRMQLKAATVADDNNESHGLIQVAPSYTVTLDFPPGYSRHEIEDTVLRPVWSPGGPFLVSLTPEADGGARLVFLTADFVTFAKSAGEAAQAKPVKCVVWDLDNTLWKGTLVEGDTVALRPEALSLLKHLDERGILLSIASKNDYAVAWQKLEELGIGDYFLYPQINWAPKSESVKSIAKRLNIGLDSLAFVDDSRFELEEVARAVPGVLCLGAAEIPKLFDDPRFGGSTSAEARQRREMYRQSIARGIAAEQSGVDYEAFLASCEISLEIAPYTPADHERVAELVQRTNQLNFSGCKYTRTQLARLLADFPVKKLVLRCADKFGSYGTVGFALVENAAGLVQVHDFMLSCRVQGKFLERAFFHHLLEHHNQECSTVFWVNFHPTERNSPARQVLESLGFRKCDPERSGLPDGMFLAVDGAPHCDFIRVTCTAAAQPGASSTSASERRGIGNA